MLLRLVLLLLATPVAGVAAEPLLLDPADWTDAPSLIRRARAAIAEPIQHVTDKQGPPPSGDPHEYVSYSRYWWPDPSKPGGLPYVRHDGRHNLEQVNLGDINRLEKFAETTELLAVVWARTGNAECAARAAEWIRAWFINPATRMNPSLDYSQVRPGHNDNRGNKAGVLDGRRLLRVVDAIRILESASVFNGGEREAIRAWLAEYYHWLTTSELGRGEAASRNNHGTWYVVQALALARHLGLEEDARRHCDHALALIRSQITPDGRQPLELERVDGLSYSTFNLEAHLRLAVLAIPVGIDLWNFVPEDGGGLRKAVDFLRPFNTGPDKWTFNQEAEAQPGFLSEVLALAARLDSLVATE